MARGATEGAELLTAALKVAGEARRRWREQRVGGGRELAVLEQRLDDGQLEKCQVGHHRGEGPTTELTPHAVPVRVGRILPGADHVARAGREQLVALDAHVHLERFAD